MNILIPHHWLLEHLDTKAKPADIAKYLSLCGPSVERIETIKNEPVYDIEITTNRVDSMCVRGIAREAATILPEFGIKAKLLPLNKGKIDRELKKSTLPPPDFKIINDPTLCHRIVTVKLSNIKISDSPAWLQKRLYQIGQRPLNNAIDITNYIMWEIGHPIHAFDYDRLDKNTIIVREAKKGEILTTLDDQTHQMLGGEVIFDDSTGTIVDLPGIMGTKNTVVTQKTKNILLWIESIDAVKIRQASMTHNIRSQAAVLNEKNVDPELALTAITQAAKLYTQICDAKITSQTIDIYPHPPKISPVKINQSLIDTYLGLKLKPEKISRILTSLGCTITHRQNEYSITPPTWRTKDLAIQEDFIEEIARIYGYHNLDSTVMPTPIPETSSNANFQLEYYIKQWLAGWGCHEIYTYSAISKELALQSKYPLNKHIQIQNPYSSEWVYLRRSLIPSLTEVLDNNPTHKTTIFELQNTYHQKSSKTPSLPQEVMTLSLVSNTSYEKVKGLLNALMGKLYITNNSVKPNSNANQPYMPDKSGDIIIDNTVIGHIGQINRTEPTWGFNINLDTISAYAHTHPSHIPPHTKPPIIEDLTFSLPPKTHVGPIIGLISSLSQLIESVQLKTIFHQNYTFTITYRRADRPLKDVEIAPIRKKIVAAMKKRRATLIGNLQ